MPRYFFNIHDEDHFTPDHMGVELEGNRSKDGSADHCEGRGRTGILADYTLADLGRPLGHGSVVSVSERAYSQAAVDLDSLAASRGSDTAPRAALRD